MGDETKAAPQPDGTPATGGQTGQPPAPPAAPPPAAGEPTTGGQPPPDWEKKFKGLQAVHQSLQTQHKGLLTEKGTLTQQIVELQGSLELVRGEIDSLKTTHEESVANLDEIQGELVDFKLWERKQARIREKHPNLLQFEKNIFVDVPDELMADPATLNEDQLAILDAAIDTAVSEFSGIMSAYVATVTQGQHAGTVPPSSPPKPSSPGETLDQLYQLAIETAGTSEYDKLMAQYEKLAAKEEGAPDHSGYWRPHQKQMPMPEL